MRRPSLVLLLLAVVASPAAAASTLDPKTLLVHGRTTDQQGLPLQRVRVWVEGGRVSTISDRDGRYSLTIPVGTAADLARAPLALSIRAHGKGWRFAIPGGDPVLRLELGIDAAPDGSPRCVARSNDERFAGVAARAVGMDGEAVGVLVIPFLGLRGEADGEPPSAPALRHVAYASLGIALPEPRAPARREPPAPARSELPAASPPPPADRAGARRDTTGPAATARAARAASSAAPQASLEPAPGALGWDGRVKRPSGGAPPAGREAGSGPGALAGGAPAPARRDTALIRPEPTMRVTRARARPLVIRNPPPAVPEEPCRCRIEGTLEVRWHRPLPRPERVEISLVGYPEIKDTVELFMGSPRIFILPEVPCGIHRLDVLVPPGRRYAVLAREGLGYFRCDRSRVLRRSLVLTPR